MGEREAGELSRELALESESKSIVKGRRAGAGNGVSEREGTAISWEMAVYVAVYCAL